MSADFIVRLIGMVLFSILGIIWGNNLGELNPENHLVYTLAVGLVGSLFGLVLTPYFTTRPVRKLRQLIRKLPAETLFSTSMGLVIGLIVGAVVAFP